MIDDPRPSLAKRAFPCEYRPHGKTYRLTREMVVTEKIDGTFGRVFVAEDGQVFAGSRNRWISPEDDNYGFAKWVETNAEELRKLGEGCHDGEWAGQGIQRNYGAAEKSFFLFNAMRWSFPIVGGEIVRDKPFPSCCRVVPILCMAQPFDTARIQHEMDRLRIHGSFAYDGFPKPEGIVIFHTASGHLYKKTFENDEGKFTL